MEHSENGDMIRTFNEIHTIGEMTEKRSTDFAFQLWELFRVVSDAPEDFFEPAKEPHAQPRSLVFVPQGGCLDVEL